MFKIGEFSKLTQVSIRMLRHYDETGLLKPAAIGKFTNYRLYSAEQIPALNQIIFWRDLGFKVSEIAVALSRQDNEFIIAQLEGKRLEIERALQIEQDKLSKIELAKKDVRLNKIAVHYNVSIKTVPSRQVLSLRRTIPNYYAEGELWKEMSAFAVRNNIPISSETFTIYHDEDYREKNVDVEICAPTPEIGAGGPGFTYRNTEPVPLMAGAMSRGRFENIAGAYIAFADWLREHNQYKIAGPNRQIVHRGPWNEINAAKYLTEIQIPLERA